MGKYTGIFLSVIILTSMITAVQSKEETAGYFDAYVYDFTGQPINETTIGYWNGEWNDRTTDSGSLGFAVSDAENITKIRAYAPGYYAQEINVQIPISIGNRIVTPKYEFFLIQNQSRSVATLSATTPAKQSPGFGIITGIIPLAICLALRKR